MITTRRGPGRPPGTKLPGLKETRHRFGLTAHEFAVLSGVHVATIYKCEAGKGTSEENATRIRGAVVKLIRERREHDDEAKED